MLEVKEAVELDWSSATSSPSSPSYMYCFVRSGGSFFIGKYKLLTATSCAKCSGGRIFGWAPGRPGDAAFGLEWLDAIFVRKCDFPKAEVSGERNNPGENHGAYVE